MFQRLRVRRSYVLGLLLPLLIGHEGVVGQETQRDRLIMISMTPESLGAVYPEGLDSDVLHWIYPGEPVVVQLALSNHGAESIQIPRTPREWFEAARLTLVPKSQLQSGAASSIEGAAPVSVRLLRRDLSGRASLGRDALRLDGPGAERVRLQVARPDEFTVPPGVYLLSVSLDEQIVPVAERHKHLLHAERLIGVRAIESRADAMNQAAHMATWARLDRDFGTARRWLNELLSLNPRSSVAYAHLGQVARAEGRCKEAIEHWGKAVEILAANGDPEGRHGSGGSISSLRSHIQRADKPSCRFNVRGLRGPLPPGLRLRTASRETPDRARRPSRRTWRNRCSPR
jgi:hypothetical protein